MPGRGTRSDYADVPAYDGPDLWDHATRRPGSPASAATPQSRMMAPGQRPGESGIESWQRLVDSGRITAEEQLPNGLRLVGGQVQIDERDKLGKIAKALIGGSAAFVTGGIAAPAVFGGGVAGGIASGAVSGAANGAVSAGLNGGGAGDILKSAALGGATGAATGGLVKAPTGVTGTFLNAVQAAVPYLTASGGSSPTGPRATPASGGGFAPLATPPRQTIPGVGFRPGASVIDDQLLGGIGMNRAALMRLLGGA